MLDRFLGSLRQTRRLRAVIPSSCALCGSCGDAALCEDCHARFFFPSAERCRQCGLAVQAHLLSPARQCGNCLRQSPAFDATVVAIDYAPPVDQLVLALKFGHRLALAPLFSRLIHQSLPHPPVAAMPDLLTAVPLSESRLRARGFNQALEIARPLAQATGIPLAARLLVRTRETQMQSRLHPDARQRNIRHAFALSAGAIDQVNGRHVGVVDDVMTTGETLNEIAATLKKQGAARVTNLVFARTPK